MYKKLLLEIANPTDTGYGYRVIEGEKEAIFEDIFSKTGGKADDETNGFKVWLVVHPMEEFLNAGDRMQGDMPPFAQDLLLYDQEKRDKEERELAMFPVMHITTTTIMLPAIYTSAPLHRLVPRYHLIIDDSIWNYHVSIFGKDLVGTLLPEKDPITMTVRNSLKDFPESFRDVLQSIKRNYDRHLYHLQVAKEYSDLHARMSAQAYLTGSHAVGVSPFVFHSEGFVKMMIKREFESGEGAIETSLKKDDIIKHKWRLLLVDDKAKEEMKHNPELKESGWNNKLSIIEWTLRHYFDWKGGEIQSRLWSEKGTVCNDDCVILIEYAQTLSDAIEAMKHEKYDIVLLDYLLDTDAANKDQNYGFSLLNNIYHDKSDNNQFNHYKCGPSERFFFMFISAYSTAVYERLRAETLNLSEDYWHISLGACPTNTPQLFLYNLLKLMEKRLNDSGMTTLSANSLSRLIKDIYEKQSGGNPVRRRANKLYEKVLSRHYHYRRIMKDVAIPAGNSLFDTSGSVLMTEFVQHRTNLGGLLEHLIHLVYITAFGTIRQWPEMWEEYLFVKALFRELPDANEENLDAFNSIEQYILDLKQM